MSGNGLRRIQSIAVTKFHLSSLCHPIANKPNKSEGRNMETDTIVPAIHTTNEQFQYVPITNIRCINENKCTYAPIPFLIVNITSSFPSPLLSFYWMTALNLDRLFCSGIGTEDFLLHSLSIRFRYADTLIRYAIMVTTDCLLDTYLPTRRRRRRKRKAESGISRHFTILLVDAISSARQIQSKRTEFV